MKIILAFCIAGLAVITFGLIRDLQFKKDQREQSAHRAALAEYSARTAEYHAAQRLALDRKMDAIQRVGDERIRKIEADQREAEWAAKMKAVWKDLVPPKQ